MVCTNWRNRHSLPPYDDVSRKKEKIQWTRRVLLYIAVIVCFVFTTIDDIRTQPSKISLENFENKRFPLPKALFSFNNNSIFEFAEMYVVTFDKLGDVLDSFSYSADPTFLECVQGNEGEPCPYPLFEADPLLGYLPGKSLAILESPAWELPNFEGYALILGFGVPSPPDQQPATPVLSSVVDVLFTTDECEGNNCERIYTSSIIPAQGFSTITINKETIIDPHKKHIVSFPFKVGSVALTDEDVNTTLASLDIASRNRDVLFIARVDTNAKIVTTVHLERRGQLLLRIIIDGLGLFGGIVIIGEIIMQLVNKCLFTGTDMIDHEIRDPALLLMREQFQQMQLEMQQLKSQVQPNSGTNANTTPMGYRV